MKNTLFKFHLPLYIILPAIVSCHGNSSVPSKETIDQMALKRGELVLCGAPEKHFGEVNFDISNKGAKLKEDFNLGVALLHSFEYDEAEKVFAKIIDEEPGCAMAYWGVAMCNYHPLWTPPTGAELKKGAKAAEIARSVAEKTPREAAYIDAISAFYKDCDKTAHQVRAINFEKAMEKVYTDHPADKEAAIFYALALDAAADPADRSFQNQKRAGKILYSLYPGEPDHPGIAHYIIHTYDYPGLATLALPMAKKYATIAPSSAHALHMPSHIFTRLGLWDECIRSNQASVTMARCYAPAAGITGHWDEELHGLDYLVYGYLQKGDNKSAKEQCDYVKTIDDVYPVNFKVAYAFAAIPCRYVLENQLWAEASGLEIPQAKFPWKQFYWQSAIIHFTRLMGAVHTGQMASAKTELAALQTACDTLTRHKDAYKANQVQIQVKTGEAWISLAQGKNYEALSLMNQAADMEDKTEKHPVTPCEVIPARELLGDMLLHMHKPAEALQAYEADLARHTNRFNGLYGAGAASEKTKNTTKARYYYQQLLAVANTPNSDKPQLTEARSFLKDH